MYIRRIFGPDSPYSVQLASIEFRYMGIAVGTLERGDSPATRRARAGALPMGCPDRRKPGAEIHKPFRVQPDLELL